MRQRATEFLLSLLLLVLSIPASASLTAPSLPELPASDCATPATVADLAGAAEFFGTIDDVDYGDDAGVVRVVVVVFPGAPKKTYLGFSGQNQYGPIWILYEVKLPLGLDHVDVSSDGDVYWVVEKKGTWHDEDARRIHLGVARVRAGLLGTTKLDDSVLLLPQFGGGRVDLASLRDAARRYWNDYADQSPASKRLQQENVGLVISRIREGSSLAPYSGVAHELLVSKGARHRGSSWRGLREVSDIFEVSVSLGKQVGLSADAGPVNLKAKLNLGSQNIGFEGGRGFAKTTEEATIGAGLLKKLHGPGFEVGMKREREGLPPMETRHYWSGEPYRAQMSTDRYMFGATPKYVADVSAFGTGTMSGVDRQMKLGVSAACIVGGSVSINLSEFVDLLYYARGRTE